MKQLAPSDRQRGMTLLEILITLAIASVMLTGVFGTFIAQTRISREQGAVREATSAARKAIAALSDLVGRAGYGVEPAFTLDFSWYDCTDASYTGDAAVCAPAARDNATYDAGARTADQLVFMSRNPRYFARGENDLAGTSTLGAAWEVVSAGTTSLQVWGHEGDVFRRGQVLYVACPGAFSLAYVTVGTTTTVAGTDPKAVRSVSVPLMTQVAGHPYKQNDTLTAGCFDNGLARAFAIDRYRFFLSMDRSDAAHPRPFLFLDRGMDMNLDGVIDDADLLPVAPDVEDLQVAYVTRGGQTFGTAVPAPHQVADATTDYTLATPCTTQVSTWYGQRSLVACRPDDPQRVAPHPGNTTAIRLTVVTRTPTQRMQDGGPRPGRPPGNFSVENHDRSAEAVDGYQRVRLSTTIEVPNLGTRGVPLI